MNGHAMNTVIISDTARMIRIPVGNTIVASGRITPRTRM